MIYHIFYPLAKYFSIFNIAKYITFRSGCAFVTAFLLVMIFWRFTLKRLKSMEIEEKPDMHGHDRLEALHEGKKGTPTMGGVLLILAISLSTLIWSRWDNCFIWLAIAVILGLGALGLRDDFLKIRRGKGLSRKSKLFGQVIVGVILGILIVTSKYVSTDLNFPFLKNMFIDLGVWYVFWASLMIIATSNAVNFTDGLDGLAIGAVIINSLIFGLLSYIAGHAKFANYLFVSYVPGAGELTVFCLALVGAGLAFLWFNSYPAEVFMGDVGALALGGAIGAVALFIKQELLLFVSGGIFVMEALSVILQIFSAKIWGKKLFKAAPLHHHFQILGWKEPKIIVRFWILSVIFAALALLTLKIR